MGPTTAFDLSGQDFTIEGWFFTTRTSNYTNLFGWDNLGIEMIADWNSDGTTQIRVRRNYGTTSDVSYSVNTQYIDKWCHFSLSQSGTHFTCTLMVNLQDLLRLLHSVILELLMILELVNMMASGWEPLNGGVSEIKVYKGIAKYGNSNFTPSQSTMLNTDGPVPVVDDVYYDNLSLYLPLRQLWDVDGMSARYGDVDLRDYSKYNHPVKGNKLLHGFLPTPSGAAAVRNSTSVIDGTGLPTGTNFTISFWYCRNRPISGTGNVVNQPKFFLVLITTLQVIVETAS